MKPLLEPNISLMSKRKIIIGKRLSLELKIKKKNIYYSIKKQKYFLIKLK